MEKKLVEVRSELPAVAQAGQVRAKKKWQKPKLEDVSAKVMAQPYIRFT
ncbi:MAG TPA: hypothetical protein VJJ98_03745 [Sedimentisphaerales bacterium]|nr:hypothetical protein [Sedimentisphaerales bacterium]